MNISECNIVLTEQDKEIILEKVYNNSRIDKEMKKVANIVNDMPYFFMYKAHADGGFITQEGEAFERPYVSIGVLYNAYELFDELARFLIEEMGDSIFDLSVCRRVMENNKETNEPRVPNYQKILDIALQSKDDVSILEEKLLAFSKIEMKEIRKNVLEIKEELFHLFFQEQNILQDLLPRKKPHLFVLDRLIAKKIKKELIDADNFSNIDVETFKANDTFPDILNISFTINDEKKHSEEDICRVCALVFYGSSEIITKYKTDEDGCIYKDIYLTFFGKGIFPFAYKIVEQWIKLGDWKKSPLWVDIF